LGYHYLDTGALYRAVAWKVQASGISPSDAKALADLLAVTRITMDLSVARPLVLVDACDVTGEIRSPETSRLASVVAAIPAVRAWLLPVQRALVPEGGVVAEGRDLGTVVFPAADLKFFLEADPEVRAGRRHQELVATGHDRPLTQTSQEIAARDSRDRTRELAPLAKADDANVIDTSALEIDQVVDRMMAVVASKL
jgi:cytidylate kinase